MTLEQIQARLKEIQDIEMLKEDADLEVLTEEVRGLKEQQKTIEAEIKQRKQLKKDIADGLVGKVVAKVDDKKEKKGEKNMDFNTKTEALMSRAYETAFTKRYTVENPVYTEEEKRALNTTNGAVLIPQVWLNEIFDQIREQHPILTDLTWNNIDAIVHIPRRLAIVSGDAAVMEEGTCPLGEENTFDEVLVDLVEIQKMVEITARAGQLLPEAFKTWLVAEVRDRIGAKMAEQAIAKIKADILAENNIAAKTAGTLAKEDLFSLFAVADGLGVAKLYANRNTLYTNIYPLPGAEGQKAYIPNLQDPISGNTLGVETKVESAMADGEILLVFPQEVFFNVPGGIKTKAMEDICFKLQIAGLALMGLRLKYRKGAALLTLGHR